MSDAKQAHGFRTTWPRPVVKRLGGGAASRRKRRPRFAHLTRSGRTGVFLFGRGAVFPSRPRIDTAGGADAVKDGLVLARPPPLAA